MEFCCKNLFLFFPETSTNVLLIEQQIARPDILAAGPNLHVCPVASWPRRVPCRPALGRETRRVQRRRPGPCVCPVDPSYLLPCVCCCPWLRDGPPTCINYGRAEVVRPGMRAVVEGGAGGEAYEGKKPAGSAAGSSMLSGVVSSIPRSPATMLACTRRTCLSPCLTGLGWPPPRGLADLPAHASEFARISRSSMAGSQEVRKGGWRWRYCRWRG